MDGEARYNDLLDDLVARNDDVQAAKMMGMPSVKSRGKLVAGFVAGEDAMVFKLTNEQQRDAALALEGAHLFEPMAGRQMKEWVVVPSTHADDWPGRAEQALRR